VPVTSIETNYSTRRLGVCLPVMLALLRRPAA